jgi:hypothetical protein
MWSLDQNVLPHKTAYFDIPNADSGIVLGGMVAHTPVIFFLRFYKGSDWVM